MYPEAADYERAEPLGPTWHNLESSVRSTDAAWKLPEQLASAEGPLLYLSLGSLGSGDVELMRRLIASLAETRYRVIVSMGPQHAELELAPNMVGEEFLPQTSVLPQVDLIITHGGNNTITEGLHFGKPMIVLPLFWDQYDNAQRIDETRFGRRLDTYRHEPAELQAASDDLLADEALAARLGEVSAHLRSQAGTERAADLIAAVANGAS
jgi:MGT family glycosyltransferase